MILVDTSVWIDHLRSTSVALASLLEDDVVCIHDHVIGEVLLGSIADRVHVARALDGLPRIREATHAETLLVIETHRLFGTGLGYIDAQLLASTLAGGDRLWTEDRRLRQAARDRGIAYAPQKLG